MLYKNRIIAIMLLICLISVANVFAAEPDNTVREVVAKGSGPARDDAVRDALRNAVEQAVGVLVNSETLVQNAAVVKDEIYSNAYGFVQKFDVMAEESANGAVTVTVKAYISTSPDSALYSKLEALKLIQIGLGDPRIAVVLPEYHITRIRIPDPAGETAIIRKLLAGGFSRVVDAKQVEANYKKSLEAVLTKGDYSAPLATAKTIQQSLANLDCSAIEPAARRLSDAITKNDIPSATVASKMLMLALNKSNGNAVVAAVRPQAKSLSAIESSSAINATKQLSDALTKLDFEGAISLSKILEEALTKGDAVAIVATHKMLNETLAALDTTKAINAVKGFIDVISKEDNGTAINEARAKLEALNKGDSTIYAVAAKSMGIDFLIVGEAFSERVEGTVQGSKMLSCRARVEAKIINVSTGDIIATHGFQMGGIDTAEALASKRALNNAGEVMGEYLRAQLMTHASKTAKPLRITVRNVPTFDKAKAFEEALQHIPGVKAVYIRGYETGKIVIDIDYTGVPKPLAHMLERINSIDIVVNKVEYNAIEATMRY